MFDEMYNVNRAPLHIAEAKAIELWCAGRGLYIITPEQSVCVKAAFERGDLFEAGGQSHVNETLPQQGKCE